MEYYQLFIQMNGMYFKHTRTISKDKVCSSAVAHLRHACWHAGKQQWQKMKPLYACVSTTFVETNSSNCQVFIPVVVCLDIFQVTVVRYHIHNALVFHNSACYLQHRNACSF